PGLWRPRPLPEPPRGPEARGARSSRAGRTRPPLRGPRPTSAASRSRCHPGRAPPPCVLLDPEDDLPVVDGTLTAHAQSDEPPHVALSTVGVGIQMMRAEVLSCSAHQAAPV